MKITFLNIYNGVENRGAETFVSSLAYQLSKKHDVVIIQGGQSCDYENQKLHRIPYENEWKIPLAYGEPWPIGYYVKRFLFDMLSLHILLFTLKSIPYLFKERPDFVIPVNGRWQSPIIRLITWMYGGKMVISGQSGLGIDDIWNVCCLPNAFVALSSYAKKWAQKWSFITRVEYIPNGVDTQKFAPKGDAVYPIIKRPIVLFVGVLEAGKRPLCTVEAVSKMKKKANLFLVGWEYINVRTFAEKILGQFNERFSVKSFRHGAMPKVYRVADVFTIPSESYYAFEIVLLEAMASGLPVVTNDDPIRREIVGNAGIFVDPENTDEYAKALDTALAKNWGDLPRRQAEKFSWDKVAEQYDSLFKSLTR